ncbi:helix-turn-helix domain-containing protein [Comamonas sp.]|uniref:helix-turn-helix domain-containing protein n=1 Tax=Comamonas sp. TaxID=34028 RepID=UPI0026488AFA|nr:helix-turn-helix transcriptional regulator [Comamonas sp.]MDN5540241.1 helix-turn-helix transcriptional regulator [Comamonas sp.]
MSKSEEAKPTRHPLFISRSEQFRAALRRAKDHAAVDDNGNSRPMSRSLLCELSEVSPGTISNMLVSDKGAKESPPNPTLEVICKIAAALNVPPALLLMTGDDWEMLAKAFTTFMTDNVGSAQFNEYVNQTVLSPDYRGRPADIARDSYKIAEMTWGSPAADAKAAINATSQTFPFNEISQENVPFFMVLCSVFAMAAAK